LSDDLSEMTRFTLAKGAFGLVLLTATWVSSAYADSLEHLGTFEWPGDTVVGLSGLELSEDGQSFVTVSDRGWLLSGRFERDAGEISDVIILDYLPILGVNGLPVAARMVGDWSDAEGLAIAPDGSYWISFERWARVSRFESPTSGAQWMEGHPDFADYSENRQLEALALHPDGALYTVSEKPLRAGFPMYRLQDGAWDIAGHIPASNRFSIVGADFDDDGALYLLERKLVLGLWWQNRVRRVQIDAPDEAETLWTGKRGEFYNLEGIALWEDQSDLRVTLVSDNNGDESEPTQFVEFRLVGAD